MIIQPDPFYALMRDPSCTAFYNGDAGDVVLNSGNVSLWRNSSSIYTESARNAAQGAAVNQPAYIQSDAEFSGHGSLNFAGAKLLQTSTWSSPITTGTDYYIVKFPSSLAVNRLVDGNASGRHITTYDSVGLGMYLSAMVRGTAGSANLLAVICATFNGASSALYMNNAATPVASGDPGTSSAPLLTIGGDYSNNFYWQGKIACIAMFSSVDSAAVRAYKMRVFSARFGIVEASWLPETDPSVKAVYRVSNATVVDNAVSAITALGTTDPLKNLSQATTAKRPTYTASNALFNGQPTMEGTGGQWLDSSTFTNIGNQITYIFVGKLNQSAAQYQFLLCDLTGYFYAYMSTTEIMIGCTAGIRTNYTFPSGPCVVACVFDGATGSIYVNNSQTPVLTGNIASTSCTSIRLAVQHTNQWGFIGSVAETQLYASNSAELRQKAMLDAASRYGISGVS